MCPPFLLVEVKLAPTYRGVKGGGREEGESVSEEGEGVVSQEGGALPGLFQLDTFTYAPWLTN